MQYAYLIFAIASFVICATALFFIIKARGLKRKWLWVVGALFGYGKFVIDWSSGATAFFPINIQLFGAFAFRPAVAATWQVGFGIPIVAIVFLLRKNRLSITEPAGAESQPING